MISEDDQIRKKARELRDSLGCLGKRLDSGDYSELLVWVIGGSLACSHRPLRHHPHFGGSGLDLPATATHCLFEWIAQIKGCGIRSVISLMHPKELRHYEKLALGASDLIELYRKQGLNVGHLPWDDPAHRNHIHATVFAEELSRMRLEALRAFDELPKPILLHCSAGIDRSSPVAAFLYKMRAPQ